MCVLERGRRFGPGDFPTGPSVPHALSFTRAQPRRDVRRADHARRRRHDRRGRRRRLARLRQRPAARARRDLRRPRLAGGDRRAPSSTASTPAPRRRSTRRRRRARPRRCRRSPPSRRWRAPPAGQAEPLPIAVHFGADRHHPFSGVFQQGCDNLGRCDVGCPRMSKNTIDITYLARAETLRAEVYPLHEVHAHPPARARRRRVARGLQRPAVQDEGRGPRAAARARRRHARLDAPAAEEPRPAAASCRPRSARRYSGNGDALALAMDPTAEGVTNARTEFGPVMTSRIDELAERGLMIADGGLPRSFDDVLEVLRGVRLLTGLGRIALRRARTLATKVGLSDRPLTPARHALRAAPADRRLADLPVHRPRRRRRADAPDAAASGASTSARARAQRGAVRSHARDRAASSPRRPGRRRSSRSTPVRWASTSPSTRSAAARCPTTRATGVVDDARQGPRLRRPLRARRLDRADGDRRQPVQDDRRARRARGRAADRGAADDARLAQPRRQPGEPPQTSCGGPRHRSSRRRRHRGRATRRHRARRRLGPLVVGRRADRGLPLRPDAWRRAGAGAGLLVRGATAAPLVRAERHAHPGAQR